MVTAARKNSPSIGRNLEQNLALHRWPSACTCWVERERRRGKGERETQRSTATKIITITTIGDAWKLVIRQSTTMIHRNLRDKKAQKLRGRS